MVDALIMGAYARLAPEALIEDLAKENLDRAQAKEKSAGDA